MLLAEPGGERVAAILDDPANVVGISGLTLFEVDTAVLHRTVAQKVADRMVTERGAVAEVVPVPGAIVALARDLIHAATARIVTVDWRYRATAAHHGATFVYRDPQFASLSAGRPIQETLPDKA